MILIALDPGLAGGIATFESDSYKTLVLKNAGIMPTIKIETKAKQMQLDLDYSTTKSGKKQFIKSGPNKGQVKMKMKSPAKHKVQLNTGHIYNLFKEADVIVLENQNPMRGNAAGASATLMKNYGKLLALAEISRAKLIIVQPQTWKKYYGLTLTKEEKKTITPTKYKQMSIMKAYMLSSWNTSYDGVADAICIGNYAIEKELK